MADTKIEWADQVWNPVTGCSKISEGCQNCYAERMAKRMAGRNGYPNEDPFKVTLHPDRLTDPIKWKRPRRIFVNSMGDLFHEEVDEEFIAKVFAIMNIASWHTFIVLTKRPQRMKELLNNEDFQFHCGWFESQAVRELKIENYNRQYKWPFPNVWLGVTTENQAAADERIPLLLQTPAAIRLVSAEPLLEPILFYYEDGMTDCYPLKGYYESLTVNLGIVAKSGPMPKIDWLIAGGETGPGARPMHPDWVHNIKNQCLRDNVPFFFKSWGEWTTEYPQGTDLGNKAMAFRHEKTFYHVGKKNAGRQLDGVTWDAIPKIE